ncbi:MAG: polyprenol monophosphomannose synthase [Anaerolineaceae bacterium]|nr:polyprenol monophosphomannose synthase [Anaerolineaceae bacterium]
MSIAVIIPTYNEKENLPKITAQLMALPVDDLRLLIIDDNSPDGTGEVADGLALEFPGRVSVLHRSGKLGLGTAYISGFKHLLETEVEAIAQMDADFSHPPEKLVDFVHALKGADVVSGSRYIPGGSLDDEWPAWRKFLSRFGNEYARAILRVPIKDMTGGFRLWKREVLSSIPLDEIRSNGYVFQVEMIYVTQKMGFRITEIPFHFAERKYGQSKMNLSIQIEAALRVWQLRSRYKHLKRIK